MTVAFLISNRREWVIRLSTWGEPIIVPPGAAGNWCTAKCTEFYEWVFVPLTATAVYVCPLGVVFSEEKLPWQ